MWCKRPRGKQPAGRRSGQWLQSEESSSPRATPRHERPGAGPALTRRCGRKRGRRTIMPIPTEAWAPARSPSERFSVTERPRSAVSEERRLISSPVRVLSKKATSCLRTEENKEARSRFTMRCPAKANGAGSARGPRSSLSACGLGGSAAALLVPGTLPGALAAGQEAARNEHYSPLVPAAWRRRRGYRDRANIT